MRRLLLLFAFFLLGSVVQAADRNSQRWMFREPKITKITIIGNHFFDEGDIKAKLYSRSANFWRGLRGERRMKVQREMPRRDSLEVTYLYLTEGFLDVSVQTAYLPRFADSINEAEVRITITEGRRYYYGQATVQGDFPPKFRGDFVKIANRMPPGRAVNPVVLRQAEFDMKSILANNGYPYAQVIHTFDLFDSLGYSPTTFSINAGPLVYFGKVRIEGIDDYPEKVALRELKIKTGSLYKREDILDSQQRLYESGYFSTLTLSTDPNSPDSLNPDFLLRVRERKPMYATFQTGAAQSKVRDLLWDFTFLFGKRNFLGTRRVELSSSYQFALGSDSRLLNHIYRARYTQPWFLGIRMPLDLTGEVRPEVKSATQDYDVSSWSVAASTTRKFGQYAAIRFGFEYQSVTITGVPEDQVEIKAEEEGLSNRRKLIFDFRRDSRDNVFIPSRGAVLDGSLQYYGGFLGGDEDFMKAELSFASFQVVWPGWISATRIKGGWADAFGAGTVIPLEDRFYLGGANSIRGFRENSLGPQSDGQPTGAQVYAIFNQEFRWKTLQITRSWPLYQSLFFDMGNGFDTWDQLQFNDFAFALGTGVQIVTPAGPLRIDYARTVKSQRYPLADRWHFTILYAF
ncbi:MAG: BamA/TamA family outer membrane protein [bacterium]|nr:BamA/TamA family outer membrane protein [bacterium]